MKSEKKLINYIKDRYENLEIKHIGEKENIERYTHPIMSQYVENGIAILINDILKDKKYKYIIDPQLSVGKGKIYRPDIIICDQDNVIHGIVEVKAQLGYSGDENLAQKHKNKMNSIKKAGKQGGLSVNSRKEIFSVSEKCKDMIVILMSANNHGNIKNFEGTNYFVLFYGQKRNNHQWYDNLEEYLNVDPTQKHTYTKFTEYLKNNL